MSCGLTARTTTSAPRIASGSRSSPRRRGARGARSARSSRREVATMSAQSELRSPARSDSPILPVPRIAILMPQAYESGVVSRQQVHARDPGPLAVGLEEGVGLLGLDAPAPELRRELDEPEVAREAPLVAAEPLEADDAGRPGPEAALALEPLRGDLGREPLQLLEVGAAAEPDERGAAAGPEPEVGRARRARTARGRPRSARPWSSPSCARRGADRRVRSIARASRAVISWPATARSRAWATVAVRSGRMPRRWRVARPTSGIVGEPAQELGVVVVDARG